jgi:hypothetical protein
MVTAEKNTNPFAGGNAQNVCGDASLPATAELRGITPLIDPAVDVNGDAAALSQSSAASPLAADGLSVFDLMDQAGLGDLVVSQASAGGAGAGAAAAGGAAQGGNGAAQGGNQAAAGNGNANAGNGNANAGNGNANAGNAADMGNANNNAGNATAGDDAAAGNNNANDNQNNNANAGNNNANTGNNANAGNNNAGNTNNNAGNADAGNDNAADNQQNGNNNAGNNANNNQQDAAAGNNNANAGNQNNNNQQNGNANAGNNANNQQDAAAGNDNNNANAGADAGNAAGGAGGAEDFGLCTPTITFQGGENGRAADEFTFQIADPLARGGQGEALNPDIITNALCNQLTNVCEANAAAVATCESAAAAVQGGDRNKALADQFNSLVGFPGAVTNPDGGPEDVGAAAKARKMRRGLRM